MLGHGDIGAQLIGGQLRATACGGLCIAPASPWNVTSTGAHLIDCTLPAAGGWTKL